MKLQPNPDRTAHGPLATEGLARAIPYLTAPDGRSISP